LGTQEKWLDTFHACHPEAPGYTWDHKNPFAARVKDVMPERRIDYLFTKDSKEKLKLQSSDMVFNQPTQVKGEEMYASDHFGLLVEIL